MIRSGRRPVTEPHVLVAYGTRNGGTAEIARWIGETLRGVGIDADVVPASAVADLGGYTAVVLGSGVYQGRWLRSAVRFERRHRAALVGLPVWLFSSGPLDASTLGEDIPPVPGAVRIADRVDARTHATFGGRLAEGARGFTARVLLGQGREGDFRDRDRIQAWALGIAREISAQPQRL